MNAGQRLSIIQICLGEQAFLVLNNIIFYYIVFLPDLRKLFPRIMISHGRFRLFILQRYLHNGLHISNLRFFLVFVWIPGFESEVAH